MQNQCDAMSRGVRATQRDLCYHQHRLRVQNATSVVNSHPPAKREPEAPYKELTYIEMLTTLRRDLGRRTRTFTKSPDRQRQRKRHHHHHHHHHHHRHHQPHNHYQRERHQLQQLHQLQHHQHYQNDQQQLQQQQQQPQYTYNRINCQPASELMTPRTAKTPTTVATTTAIPHSHPARRLGGKSCPVITTHRPHIVELEQYHDIDDAYRQQHKAPPPSPSPSCGIPEHVLQRYNFLATPRNVGTLHRLLRPKLFLDLEVRDVRPLGRVVIQLYTEACPEVVLEFVRTCLAGNSQRIHFTRLLPPLWLEGELALDDNKALTAPNVEHDLDVIDHGTGTGILSFPSRYVRGVCKRRSLNFTISFKPINALNGKRIAFGRVKRGSWIIDTVQDYRTRNGKPLHEIFVKKCGLVQ